MSPDRTFDGNGKLKIHLKFKVTKSAGDVAFGVKLAPWMPEEDVPGKFGNCVKLQGHEHLNLSSLEDGNNYHSIAFGPIAPCLGPPSVVSSPSKEVRA